MLKPIAAIARPSDTDSATATAKLRQLDNLLASASETGTEATMALRGRGRVLIISEALAEHGHYFDTGAPA